MHADSNKPDATQPVAKVVDGGQWGPTLRFLATGKPFPKVGTMLYAAPQASEAECSCPSGNGSLRHPCAVHPQASEAVRIFLVPTGEVYCGQETYTRHEDHPPVNTDNECLYTSPQARDEARNLALDDAEEAVVTLYESDDPVYLPDIAMAIRALKSQSTALSAQPPKHAWSHCVFHGPAPAGYASWGEWILNPNKRSAFIRAVTAADWAAQPAQKEQSDGNQ